MQAVKGHTGTGVGGYLPPAPTANMKSDMQNIPIVIATLILGGTERKMAPAN